MSAAEAPGQEIGERRTVGAELADSLRRGAAAAKANLLPGMVLWIVACGIVAAYYFWTPAAGFFRFVGELKTEWGFLFAAISTATFGGILPFFFQGLQRAGQSARLSWRQLPVVTAFWAFRGVEVDALYRLQTVVFGDSPALWVVAPKVLADQLIYLPFWAGPIMMLVYLWKDNACSFSRTRAAIGPNWYRRRVLPLLISNWAIWVPAVTCIYLLPQPLQLPLQNIVVCFWVLLLMFLTTDQRTPNDLVKNFRPE